MENIDQLFAYLKTTTVWSNSLLNYLLAGVVFMTLQLAFKPLLKFIFTKLGTLVQRTDSTLDNLVVKELSRIHSPIYIPITLAISTLWLTLSQVLAQIIRVSLWLSLIYLIISVLVSVFEFFLNQRLRRSDSGLRKSAVKVAVSMAHVAFWALGAMLILSNVGVSITGVITVSGIVGVALALTVQKIFGGLISGFLLLREDIFRIGHYIESKEIAGKVEDFDLRATKLRLSTGELAVVPNTELAASWIRNHDKRAKREKFFTFELDQATVHEKLAQIQEWIEAGLGEISDVVYVRCHLKEIGTSSYIYRLQFRVEDADFSRFCAAEEAVNLKIVEILAANGVDLASPFQTISLLKSENGVLTQS